MKKLLILFLGLFLIGMVPMVYADAVDPPEMEILAEYECENTGEVVRPLSFETHIYRELFTRGVPLSPGDNYQSDYTYTNYANGIRTNNYNNVRGLNSRFKIKSRCTWYRCNYNNTLTI